MGDAELNDKYVERAFSLIDQVRSERERLGISVDYYRATGQSDKLADMMQLFARVYPRDSEQHAELGQLYYQNGEFKKAFQEMQELFRLKQKPSEIDYYNLMLVQILLDQLDEAKVVASKALAHGFDAPGIHLQLLVIAYTEGDRDAAANELRWFAGKPEESRLLSAQAQNAYSLGQRSKAQELYGRGTKLLESRGRSTVPDS